jgi:hypothetical protein
MSTGTKQRLWQDESRQWHRSNETSFPSYRVCGNDREDPPEFIGGLHAAKLKDFVAAVMKTVRASALAQANAQLRDDAQERAFGALQQVVRITREVFGDPVLVTETSDPEFPEEKYLTLTTESTGDNSTVLAMESEWVRRVSRLDTLWHGFRLSIKRKK